MRLFYIFIIFLTITVLSAFFAPSQATASPVKLISKVIESFHKTKRSLQPKKAKHALQKNCEHLADTYQKFKGSLECHNKCGGLQNGTTRASCFTDMIKKIQDSIDLASSELDSRIAFRDYCAENHVGRKKNPLTGKRDGELWKNDAGHQIRIDELSNQIRKCRAIAKLAIKEITKDFNTTPSKSQFLNDYSPASVR